MPTKSLIAELYIQLGLLEELLAVAQQETGSLSDIDLDRMAEINTRKADVSARIEAHVDPLRQAIVAAAGREGLQPGSPLGDVAAILARKGHPEVSRLHGELHEISQRIRQTLEINREVAERFAASVTSSLEMITRLINQSSMYGSGGGYQQRPVGSVIINREA